MIQKTFGRLNNKIDVHKIDLKINKQNFIKKLIQRTKFHQNKKYI